MDLPKLFFWQAEDFHGGGIYVNPLVDYNTVGPVSTASGYGSRTFTHSAVHVLYNNKDNASAPLTSIEEIHIQKAASDKELSET